MGASTSSGDDDVVSDINVTPLVDVVLVLLIVFMITMPAIVGSAPVQVDLPATKQIRADAEKLPLNFALKKEGEELVLYINSDPATDAKLQEAVSKNKPITEQTVTLSADKTIPYGEVVKVMDRLSALGMRKIALNTKPSAGG